MNDASQQSQIADAIANSFVGHLPHSLQPYAQMMRLDRPIGWWLLLLPCWWGLLLAQMKNGGGWPDFYFAFLFLAGAIVMRGAGCVVNDLADADIDAKVARTRLRPLPSGRISKRSAVIFIAGLLLLGLLILVQFNRVTVITGICSLAIVAIYPFMKRVTDYPQFVLGLAFNWGALLGWTALQGAVELPALLLYAGGIAWTLAYDTIYAHQDKTDDALIGVRSTALKFGKSTPVWLSTFFALALVFIDLALISVKAPLIAHAGVAAAALHAAWQVRAFRDDDPALCLKLFRTNRMLGLLITAGFLMGNIIR